MVKQPSLPAAAARGPSFSGRLSPLPLSSAHLAWLDRQASLRCSTVVRQPGIPTSPALPELLSVPNPTPSTDSEQEGRTRRKTVNMEGFSIPTASIHEEWMDLADIVNNDLENDLEKKKLSDISGFDVVGLFNNNNNNNSDKSFQRQQSYLDIFKDIEGEELMLGIDSVETSIFIDNTSNNNISNNNDANAKVVAAREGRTSSLTGYSHYSPASPTDSWISTEDFPEELDELQPFEMGDQLQLAEQVAATFTLEVINKTEEASEEEMEEQSDSDEDYVPEYSKPVRRKSRAHQDTFKDDDAFEDAHKDSSDSDPDFDPEDFEEVVRPAKKSQRSRKEPTSDYESEELSEEEKPQRKLVSRRSRKPSRNPIPQQRKKGSTLKISQWIVELLRNPETNPSVIMWEDEPAGKFRVINSNAFAQLWAKVKNNPAMNYEKLSRAMRYYYRNKEIEMVKGERLTYKFGPNMRDFRAKDRKNPNFQSRGK